MGGAKEGGGEGTQGVVILCGSIENGHVCGVIPAPSLYKVLCTHQRSKKRKIRG